MRAMPTRTPIERASSSPSISRFRSRAISMITAAPPSISGAEMRTCSQERESSPPASQKRISRSASLSGRRMMIAETMAPRKALTATPASRSVAMEKRPPTAAMPYTRNEAAIAPHEREDRQRKEEQTCHPGCDGHHRTTAPPADTPMMPGSAMGLRKSPCIVAPATPSATAHHGPDQYPWQPDLFDDEPFGMAEPGRIEPQRTTAR